MSVRGRITFWGGMCSAIVGFIFVSVANAQVHNCTIEEAEDFTSESEIELSWSNPHHRCVLISPGTEVTWNGDFGIHPLTGGVSPSVDFLSPISSAVAQGGAVVLNGEDDYPYFCEIHGATMTGVIYVRDPLSANEVKHEDGFETK